jgi:hypothetical protein
MIEHPIIYTAENVRAILEGRKTQTRRIIKPQPGIGLFARSCFRGIDKPEPAFAMMELGPRDGKFLHYLNCPYGQPGDRLYVREAFAQMYRGEVCIKDENDPLECKDCRDCEIVYKAENPGDKYPGGWDDGEDPDCPRWKSPYHMHRWQSRINLKIDSIHVERLQDITLEDIKAEGCTCAPVPGQLSSRNDGYQYYKAFEYLWDSINTSRGFPWSSNPFVWAIEFQRIPKEAQ